MFSVEMAIFVEGTRLAQEYAVSPTFLILPAFVVIHVSQASNIAFLLDLAQMSDLDFGLIQQNISIKKASFQYQGCPLSFKSGKL